MFAREHLLANGWYRERLEAKQWQDRGLWQRHVASIHQFLDDPKRNHAAERLQIADRLHVAEAELRRVWSPGYLQELRGMLGLDPALRARMPATATPEKAQPAIESHFHTAGARGFER